MIMKIARPPFELIQCATRCIQRRGRTYLDMPKDIIAELEIRFGSDLELKQAREKKSEWQMFWRSMLRVFQGSQL